MVFVLLTQFIRTRMPNLPPLGTLMLCPVTAPVVIVLIAPVVVVRFPDV
jgi:hypothetical protein